MKLPRFTLRDLFWLVLVCALAVGWWVDHWLQSERIAKLTLNPSRQLPYYLLDDVQHFGPDEVDLDNAKMYPVDN